MAGNIYYKDITIEKASFFEKAEHVFQGGKPVMRQGTLSQKTGSYVFDDGDGQSEQAIPVPKVAPENRITIMENPKGFFAGLSFGQKAAIITTGGAAVTGGLIYLWIFLTGAAFVVQEIAGKKRWLGLHRIKKAGEEWIVDLSKLGFSSDFARYFVHLPRTWDSKN